MPAPSPGSPTLLLFPTELERRRFEDQGGLEPGLALSALGGFGAVAAAARTAELLARLRPRRVLLLGIAGTYDAGRLAVGKAAAFTRVAIDGIGAGEGARFRGPVALGFPQWPGSTGSPAITDTLELSAPSGSAEALLVTSCAASDGVAQAHERRARFPGALAEDMEGFAVALASALAGVPCAVVRGISNVVGDRDPAHWRIPGALAAARRLAGEVLEDPEWTREQGAP
jgi:futalosine hydrolase